MCRSTAKVHTTTTNAVTNSPPDEELSTSTGVNEPDNSILLRGIALRLLLLVLLTQLVCLKVLTLTPPETPRRVRRVLPSSTVKQGRRMVPAIVALTLHDPARVPFAPVRRIEVA